MTDKALEIIADRLNELGVPYAAMKKKNRDRLFLKGWVLVTKDVTENKIWLAVRRKDSTLRELFEDGFSNV